MAVRLATEGDHRLWKVLLTHKKIPQDKARYSDSGGKEDVRCGNCKFFIELDSKCFISEGKIVAEGACRYFTSWEEHKEPFPGDVVWEFVRKTREKLTWKEGYIILRGDEGYQCNDCKFYLYTGACLIIKGKFKPEMSCRYILKPGEGRDLVQSI